MTENVGQFTKMQCADGYGALRKPGFNFDKALLVMVERHGYRPAPDGTAVKVLRRHRIAGGRVGWRRS